MTNRQIILEAENKRVREINRNLLAALEVIAKSDEHPAKTICGAVKHCGNLRAPS